MTNQRVFVLVIFFMGGFYNTAVKKLKLFVQNKAFGKGRVCFIPYGSVIFIAASL